MHEAVRRRRLTWGLGGLVLLLAACWPGARSPGGRGAEAQLIDVLRGWETGDTVTVAGFRLEDGKTSPETSALDEVLLSAAVRAGLVMRPGAGVAGSASAADLRWSPASPLPRAWRETAAGGLLAAGLVRTATPWVYLRLQLADASSGTIRRAATVRVAEREVQALARERQSRLTTPEVVALPDIEVELHVVVRRDESGFPQRVDWVEGGQLDEGDRLQLRFRSRQDCDVYAFLYRSSGETTTLFDGAVFADRWSYSPAENGWETLAEGDQVYTIYFLASRRIEDDKATLWDELSRLQSQGRVEKFRGLDLVDAAVEGLLQRTAAADTVRLVRGVEGVERGAAERFIYGDGAAFDSRGDLLSGQSVARAYSAEVLFR